MSIETELPQHKHWRNELCLDYFEGSRLGTAARRDKELPGYLSVPVVVHLLSERIS